MRARDDGFDRKPEEGGEPLQRAELIIAESIGSIRRPIGIHTIHLADRAVFGEAVDDRDIVRELRLTKLREGREFSFGLRGHTQAQHRFAAVQKPVKRACPPPFQRLPLGGSPVFGQRHFRLFSFPAKRPALVNGMERVDEHHHASERQSPRDCAAAKALDQGGLATPLEPRFREPGRKLGDLRFGHGTIIVGLGRKANARRPMRQRRRLDAPWAKSRVKHTRLVINLCLRVEAAI